jgi:hypothetical protein
MPTKETEIINYSYSTISVLCRVDKGWEDNYMKTRWMHLTAGLTMFVLCISVCTTTANATLFLEEHFDNEDPPGWTMFGYENMTSLVTTEGSFSVVDGRLTALGDDINIARHDSDMTVGSWCWDMFVPDEDDGWFYVYLMSNGTRPFPAFASTFVCVGAWILENDFLAWQGTGTDADLLSNIYMDSIQGLHRIKVNRTSDGYYEVYINRTLRGFFERNEVVSSTYFEVGCRNATGAWVDNIYVSDDLNFEPPPPTTTPTTTPTTPPPGDFPWILVAVVGGVAAGVIVLAIVCLRRR